MPHVFAKLAVDLHRNPKIRKAGRLGREVFVFCLCVNADRGATGRVPAEYLEPWFLADTLQMTEDEAREGLARAVAAGLIEMCPDMSGHLSGWDEEEWGRARGGSMTEAERKQAQRDQKRAREKNQVDKPVRTPRPDMSGRPDHSESDAESESEADPEKRIPPARAAREPEPGTPKVDPDPNQTERKRLLALLVPVHVEVFNRVRSELGAAVPVMQPMGDPAERALQTLLRDRVSLQGAEAECRHVLAVRENEARRTRSMKYLGASVWNPTAFARALAMEVGEAGDAPRPRGGGGGAGGTPTSGFQALMRAGADPPPLDDVTNPTKPNSDNDDGGTDR